MTTSQNLDAQNGAMVQVPMDLGATHDLSVNILKQMENSQVEFSLGVFALAMSLGRLLSPKEELTADEETLFIQAFLDWAGTYFVEGSAN